MSNIVITILTFIFALMGIALLWYTFTQCGFWNTMLYGDWAPWAAPFGVCN